MKKQILATYRMFFHSRADELYSQSIQQKKRRFFWSSDIPICHPKISFPASPNIIAIGIWLWREFFDGNWGDFFCVCLCGMGCPLTNLKRLKFFCLDFSVYFLNFSVISWFLMWLCEDLILCFLKIRFLIIVWGFAMFHLVWFCAWKVVGLE